MIKYDKIYLGSICNNKCSLCLSNKAIPFQSDLNTIFNFLEQKQSLENILLYGGEPTLRKDILQIIQKAVTLGAKRIKILTNGRILSDINTLYSLMDAGCFLFEIKLWGSNPVVHDKITRITGSFHETISSLNNLAPIQDKFVAVRIPICKDNYRDIQNIVILSINFGVNRIILSYNDPNLSLKDILPFVINSLNISIFNRTWILTEGFPFCVMKDLAKHMNEIYGDSIFSIGYNLTHHNKCSDCVFRTICPGIDSEYIKNNSIEFSPVLESKYLEDIRRLYES